MLTLTHPCPILFFNLTLFYGASAETGFLYRYLAIETKISHRNPVSLSSYGASAETGFLYRYLAIETKISHRNPVSLSSL
ncbi:MAG: hypothetical protein KME29_12770 [Calothrix sp. FI2-JRJ7]|nr:hypothetical protein [Calothrix sp. FI2-JRJ7]